MKWDIMENGQKPWNKIVLCCENKRKYEMLIDEEKQNKKTCDLKNSDEERLLLWRNRLCVWRNMSGKAEDLIEGGEYEYWGAEKKKN
jgi:hypothetical protein